MGREPKYSKEIKIKACIDYLTGKKSVAQISRALDANDRTVREWICFYEQYGTQAFDHKKHNDSYSKEFKLQVVQEYLQGKGSYRSLAVRYNINHSMVAQWVKKYNDHMELRDYDPASEVYMKDTLKTTLEERIEIVQYCLSHDRNYKAACKKYNCKYAQLYQWVRKYERSGEEGLIDRRGRRRKEEELTELEKAQRKIARLERENEELRMRNELLKKAEEIERRCY